MYRTRNAACLNGYRGFESHPLRHFSPKLGTPIAADFPPEMAESVRSSSSFDPMMRTSVSETSTPLGESAQVIPPIAAPVEPDALPSHLREPAHRGGRDGLISGAFEHRLCPFGRRHGAFVPAVHDLGQYLPQDTWVLHLV